MKLVNDEVIDVVRSVGIVDSTFSMDATSQAFDLLSSGLYSDKPRAVVRELACNAYDSHVAAGCADRPIEIHLPSQFDLTFYVKDFGTGLTDFEVRGGWINRETDNTVSDEDVTMSPDEYLAQGYVRTTGVYNTYFRSTKTKSDDFIGQLGLGSKSPFSYASTFNVEVCKDGVVRLYTCFKNEEGTPAITLMFAQPTTEGNGITVSMSIRRDDVTKFQNAANQSLMHFTPHPIVTCDGEALQVPAVTYSGLSGENWKIRDRNSKTNMAGMYVVQGFVSYPVDVNILKESGLSAGAAKLASHLNVDLFVSIGSVRSAASREALQYDRRTIANLIEDITKVAAEYRESVQAEFRACTTVYQGAQVFCKHENNAVIAAIAQDTPFTIADGTVVTGTNIPIHFDACDNISVKQLQRRTGYRNIQNVGMWPGATTTTDYMNIKVREHTYFLYSDRSTNVTKCLTEYIDSKIGGSSHHSHQIILVTARTNVVGAPAKLTNARAECKLIADELGVTFIDVATLRNAPQPVKTTRNAKTKAINTRNVWDGFKTQVTRRNSMLKYSSRCWKAELIDLAAGGMYIPITGFVVSQHPAGVASYERNNLTVYLNMCVDLGFTTSVKVVGMNLTEVEAARKAGGTWINLFDHVKQQLLIDPNYKNVCIANAVRDGFDNEVSNTILSIISTCVDNSRITSGPIYELGVMQKALEDAKLTITQTLLPIHIKYINHILDLSQKDIDKAVLELTSKWEEAIVKYPMLGVCVDTYRCLSVQHAPQIADYITLVESSVVQSPNP